MGFSAEDLFLDFCIISSLLFISKLIRLRVKFLQKHFIPTALIAGILAFIGGKSCLNVLPFSEGISAYCGPLQIMLSASLFIGCKELPSFKKMISSVGDSFLLNCAAELGQYGISVIVGCFAAAKLFPEIKEWFGVLMPAGFAGSHGTAAIVSSVFTEAGFAEAYSIGQTFATIGLLFGIFGGVAFVNLGVKKGYTKIITQEKAQDEEMLTGLVKPENRETIGENTMNSMSIDTLSWHVALILTSVSLGYILSELSGKLMGGAFKVPVYGIALAMGIILELVLKKFKLESYTDERIINRIGNSVTDYMVAFGIASIDLKIFMGYIKPILFMSAVGIIFSVMFLFTISKKCFRNYWFERGIFIFGWVTAAMPVALMLLRLVDPGFKSDILKETSFAWIFLTFAEIAVVTFVPALCLRGFNMTCGLLLTAASAAMVGIAFWYTKAGLGKNS